MRMSKKKNKKPSIFFTFLTRKLWNYANKRMIKTAKKDPGFAQLLINYSASVQINTKDDLINTFLIFDGKGGVKYSKGKIENPDASLIFRSVKDLFIILKNFGDIYEGMLESRFELRGNLNVLFKYQFLTNYYNPKVKKIKNISEKLVATLEA